MNKLKKYSSKIFTVLSKIPNWIWLLFCLLLPLNFFCLKEAWLKKESASAQILAFQFPQTAPAASLPIEELLSFSITSQTKNTSCQLIFGLDKQELERSQITLKKETRLFDFPSNLLDKIKDKKGGRVEIVLDCPENRENIYKYLTLP